MAAISRLLLPIHKDHRTNGWDYGMLRRKLVSIGPKGDETEKRKSSIQVGGV